jgi:hypothetical protein
MGGMMKTQRYHFSVVVPERLRSREGEVLHAFVPNEGSEDLALARVKADDPIWVNNPVLSHGLEDWFERIEMTTSIDAAREIYA